MVTNTYRLTGRPPHNPAAIALMTEGCSQRLLAEHLGCTRRAVSYWLGGRRRMDPRLPAVLAEQLGQDAADRVLIHVPAVERT